MRISRDVARRFILGRQGLWPGRRWRGIRGTEQAMRAMEHLQLDPLQVVARALARGMTRFLDFLEATSLDVEHVSPALLRERLREVSQRL